MITNITNILKITINAAAQKVWDALTLPELVKQWQYGSELTTDWIPGRPIRFAAKWQDQVFEQWGTVLEVHPCKQIVYNHLHHARVWKTGRNIISLCTIS